MSLEFKDISLIDALDGIVTSMQVDGQPYFRYGNIKEIGNLLMEVDKSSNSLKYKKYPLVILPLDVSSNYNQKKNTFDYENVTLYIVNYTKPESSASQRKTESFDAVLIPIYERLIKAVRNSPMIDNSNNIPFIAHTKTDRYFWGSSLNKNNTKNILGDYLDAIEISKLKLSVKNINC